ncbi:MAG: hypothetical protein K6A44_01170 [bacterium]|nr:hypothetical protein [bacterium]
MSILKFLKSFDIFNSEAIRFLKDKTLNIFLLESQGDKKGSVGLSSDKNAININVVNRPKTYRLLVSAKRRMEERRAREKQATRL